MDSRFSKSEDNTYQSSDFDSAANKVEITFNSEEAIKVAAFGHNPEAAVPLDVIGELIHEIGEEADWSLMDDGLTINGWTGGKYYDDGTDTFLETLSGFATGVMEGRGEEGNHWRTRLFKDGTIQTYEGEIVYPGDPGPEA